MYERLISEEKSSKEHSDHAPVQNNQEKHIKHADK